MNNKFYRTLTGCIILFVTICVIITITVFVYAAAVESYGDNRGAISGIMLVCVAFFSLACTVIDILRRRMFTQKPLEEIGEATRRISEGDFSVRLPIEKRERSFNEFDYIKSHINDIRETPGTVYILLKNKPTNYGICGFKKYKKAEK